MLLSPALVLTLGLAPLGQEPGPDPRPDPLRWLPADVAVVAVAPGAVELLAAGLAHPLVAALLGHPAAAPLLADLPLAPAEALAALDGLFGRPLLPELAALGSRGLALGLAPPERQSPQRRGPGGADGEPRFFLVLEGDDPDRLEDNLGSAFDLLAAQFQFDRRLLDAPLTRVGTAEVYSLGEGLGIVRDGASLVLTRGVGDALRAVDAARGQRPAVSERPHFRAAQAPGAGLWVFADVAALAAADPKLRQGLDDAARNPAVHFLLGPHVAGLARAEALALTGQYDGGVLELSLRALGVDHGPAAVALPRTPPPTALSEHRHEALRAVLHRDAAALTKERAALFPPTALPGFSKALSDLTPLLAGLDLFDDVLPGVSPWLRVVARDVAFESGRAPAVALPAACLVAHVRDPAVGEALLAAFQSLISVVNIEAAQERRPALLLGLMLVDGVSMTYARYPKPGADARGEPVDARYNLAPGAALVGEHFVIGTHHHLVAEVVGELRASAAAPPEDTERAEALTLRGAALARFVLANRAPLALDAVLTKGKTRARAEAELDALAALLEGLGDVTAELTCADVRRIEVRLAARTTLAPPLSGR